MPATRTHPVRSGNASYESAVLALNPVGFWRCAEVNGTSISNLAAGNAGTLTGGTMGTARHISRDSGTSLTFAGSTSRVAVTNYAALYQASMTLCMWYLTTTTNYTTASRLIAMYDGPANKRMWGVLLSGNPATMRIYTSDNGTNSSGVDSTISLDTGLTFLAFTCNNSTKAWEIFKNGASVNTLTSTYSYSNKSSDLQFAGDSYSAGVALTGQISNVAIFPSILTAAQLYSLWAIGNYGA